MITAQDYLYTQPSGQGCLAVCLAYLCGNEPNRDYEQYMVSQGVFVDRDNYVLGMVYAFRAFCETDRVSLYIGFERPRYTRYLLQQNKYQNLGIKHCDAYELLQVDTIPRPYIVYLDRHGLGAYYHYPHFVLVLKHTPQTYLIFDPWDGKTRRHDRTKVIQAVRLLDEHLRVCPVIIWRSSYTKM